MKRKTWALGPLVRRTESEVCICGGEYTTEWAHAQTKRHKAHEAAYRHRTRVQTLIARMERGEVREGGRAHRRAVKYLTGVTA